MAARVSCVSLILELNLFGEPEPYVPDLLEVLLKLNPSSSSAFADGQQMGDVILLHIKSDVSLSSRSKALENSNFRPNQSSPHSRPYARFISSFENKHHAVHCHFYLSSPLTLPAHSVHQRQTNKL